MGNIAEDLISGLCCHMCGIYFKKEHGYPVLCNYCYNFRKSELIEIEIEDEPPFPRAIYGEV